MNVGKSLFAQVMEFVPWKTFGRIIERYKGDAGVRTLSCADLFRVMALAQLTWRESLRDIEACLAAHQTKLFHMGLKAAPARSTLADALERRDWRIYHALAQRLIVRARALYAQEPSVLLLDEPTTALDLGHQHEVLTLVDELRLSRTLTVVSALHDLTLAGQYAEHFLLLDGGVVVADGTAAEVLAPDLLERCYGTPVTVVDSDGTLVVVPPRPRRHAASRHSPTTGVLQK